MAPPTPPTPGLSPEPPVDGDAAEVLETPKAPSRVPTVLMYVLALIAAVASITLAVLPFTAHVVTPAPNNPLAFDMDRAARCSAPIVQVVARPDTGETRSTGATQQSGDPRVETDNLQPTCSEQGRWRMATALFIMLTAILLAILASALNPATGRDEGEGDDEDQAAVVAGGPAPV